MMDRARQTDREIRETGQENIHVLVVRLPLTLGLCGRLGAAHPPHLHITRVPVLTVPAVVASLPRKIGTERDTETQRDRERTSSETD